MIPGLNFNPNFANLAALHGLGGGMHPRPIGTPVFPTTGGGGWGAQPPPNTPWGPYDNGQVTEMQPPPMAPMQAPQFGDQAPQFGNPYNLRALMQLLGQYRG